MPLTSDTVDSDLKQPALHDYARFCQGPLEAMTPDLLWARHFKPIKQALDASGPALRALGAEVVLDATLRDVGALLERFQVVTILGHWKGPLFLPSDILDVVGLSRQILEEDSRLCRLLRMVVGDSSLRELVNTRQPQELAPRHCIAELLNRAISTGKPLFRINAERLALTELEMQEFNREQIDVWFESKIYPGNRLELRDGLFTSADLAALVPPAYTGTIHLALCTSVLLQRQVSGARWRVLANERTMAPLLMLEVYRTVLEILSETSLSYGGVWLHVLDRLKTIDVTSGPVPRCWLLRVFELAKRVLGFGGVAS